MKFTIERSLLLDKLNIVSHALPVKSPLPSLYGILVGVRDDKGMRLTASDSNINIVVDINKDDFTIEDNGLVLVPGKMFLDIIRTLNAKEVTVEVDGNVLRITANKGKYKLNLMDETTYPDIDMNLDAHKVVVKKSMFTGIIKNTIISTASNEKKPVLTGVNLAYSGNKLVATATDSFRLSRDHVDGLDIDGDFNITIPNGALTELLKCCNSDDTDMTIYMSQVKIKFEFDGIVFISRLIDSVYPDTQRLINLEAHTTVLELNKQEVLDVADRILVFSPSDSAKDKEITYNVITLRKNGNDAVLEVRNSSLGDAKEEFNITADNDEHYEISFNGKYFTDAVKSFTSSDTVKINLNGATRPFIITDGKTNLIQLILPVRV